MGFDDEYDDDKTVYGFPGGNDDDSRSLPEDEVWLVVANTNQRFLLPDGSRKSIGRGKDQDVHVPDPEKRISRQHLILSRNGQEIEIEVTGLNGIVVNSQHVSEGKRVVEFPPFRIEFGDIVLELDVDLTVTHNFNPRGPAPSSSKGSLNYGRRAGDRLKAPPSDRREGNISPAGHDRRAGDRRNLHPSEARGGNVSPPHFGRRAEDRPNARTNDNLEGTPPTSSFGRRAVDQWSPPPPQSQESYRQPEQNAPPGQEKQHPRFEENPPAHWPGKSPQPTPSNSSQRSPYPENPSSGNKSFSKGPPIFQPNGQYGSRPYPSEDVSRSTPEGTFAPSTDSFGPTPEGGEDSPIKFRAPNNNLVWSFAALTAILGMLTALFFMWPKKPDERISAPALPALSPNGPPPSPPPQATADFDGLMIDRAEQNIETGNYEDAFYYLNRIPQDSPLSNKAAELIAKIQRLKGAQE